MPDRAATASRICWADLVLLLPMLLLLPFAAIAVPVALKAALACASGDTLNCTYAAAPLAQFWYYAKAVGVGLAGLAGGLAVTLVAVLSTAELQRRRVLSRLLGIGLLLGSGIALWMLVSGLSRDPRGLGATLFVLTFTVLPLLVAARHLPRVLRAACAGPVIPPIPPVPHVQ